MSLRELDNLNAPDRRAIARAIDRRRKALAAGWAERHRAYPLYAASVLDELDGWDAYAKRHAGPLLYVLARGFASGELHFFHIYWNERLRFAPAAQRRRGGDAEIRKILADDTDALVAATGLDGRLSATLRAVLAAIHAPVTDPVPGKPLRVAFVGDCVMTEIQSFLQPALQASGIALEPHHFYFSARLGAELATAEIEKGIETIGFDLIALSFLTFEGLPVYTSLLREAASGKASDEDLLARCDAILSLIDRYIATIRAKTAAPILLHGCSGLPLERLRQFVPLLAEATRGHRLVASRLNEGLAAMADGIENVVFVDEAALTARTGLRAMGRRLLSRVVTHGALFHPSMFGVALAEDYARIVRAYALLANTKVLLVDFDNTLWEGVMAEGDVLHNLEAQRLLLTLKQAGILLVSLSKNDPRNIRWDELALAEDDFVLHKISWDTKPQSVLEVAQQLDLDPKSFVLIDDNPVERDLVTAMVPGVRAMDPLDPVNWKALALLMRFPATRQTEEAARRTAMYREAAERREATAANVDYGAMMRSLDLRVQWRRAEPGDLDRLHELVSRTNQFNTTTVRYGLADLSRLMADPAHDVFVATLADKFGALGVVGSVVTRTENGALTYESVVMSCRAMGFGLEALLVRAPLEEREGLRSARGFYVATERNNPCADLFSRSGFEDAGDGEWRLELADGLPAVPDWLAVERKSFA